MNGIDKIADKIIAEAQQEITDILEKAQAEAKAITDSFATQANNEHAQIVSTGEIKAEDIVKRAKSAAELAARQQLLATKQQLISEAFDKALDHLLNLPENDYVSLLGRLGAQASITGTETVVLSPKDQQRCGQQVVAAANEILAAAGRTATLTLSTETRPFVGGLLLKAGDVEVNCTLDSIVYLSKDNLALDVAAALFA
jgi:V/A-type H+-transporting ATPase subunit E